MIPLQEWKKRIKCLTRSPFQQAFCTPKIHFLYQRINRFSLGKRVSCSPCYEAVPAVSENRLELFLRLNVQAIPSLRRWKHRPAQAKWQMCAGASESAGGHPSIDHRTQLS